MAEPRSMPSADVVAFPMARRIGKIRDVAGKMLAKTTERHAAYYRGQVTAALKDQLARLGLPDPDWDRELSAFWKRVQAEMIRMTFEGRLPGGTAA